MNIENNAGEVNYVLYFERMDGGDIEVYFEPYPESKLEEEGVSFFAVGDEIETTWERAEWYIRCCYIGTQKEAIEEADRLCKEHNDGVRQRQAAKQMEKEQKEKEKNAGQKRDEHLSNGSFDDLMMDGNDGNGSAVDGPHAKFPRLSLDGAAGGDDGAAKGPDAPPVETEGRTEEEQAVYEERMEIVRKHPELESIREQLENCSEDAIEEKSKKMERLKEVLEGRRELTGWFILWIRRGLKLDTEPRQDTRHRKTGANRVSRTKPRRGGGPMARKTHAKDAGKLTLRPLTVPLNSTRTKRHSRDSLDGDLARGEGRTVKRSKLAELPELIEEIPELIEQDPMIAEGKKKVEGEQVEKAEEEGREKDEAVLEMGVEAQENDTLLAAEIPELIEQDEAMIGEGKKKDEGEQVEKAEEEGREKGEAVVELREEEQDNGIDALLADETEQLGQLSKVEGKRAMLNVANSTIAAPTSMEECEDNITHLVMIYATKELETSEEMSALISRHVDKKTAEKKEFDEDEMERVRRKMEIIERRRREDEERRLEDEETKRRDDDAERKRKEKEDEWKRDEMEIENTRMKKEKKLLNIENILKKNQVELETMKKLEDIQRQKSERKKKREEEIEKRRIEDERQREADEKLEEEERKLREQQNNLDSSSIYSDNSDDEDESGDETNNETPEGSAGN